jgi:hypothetical protein
MPTISPFITEGFAPVAYRVWWRHHDSKLVSTKRPPEAFRDFPTEEEAAEFKQSMQASHPYSVVSSKPIHVTHRKREARYDARQYNAAADWPLQRKPQR